MWDFGTLNRSWILSGYYKSFSNWWRWPIILHIRPVSYYQWDSIVSSIEMFKESPTIDEEEMEGLQQESGMEKTMIEELLRKYGFGTWTKPEEVWRGRNISHYIPVISNNNLVNYIISPGVEGADQPREHEGGKHYLTCACLPERQWVFVWLRVTSVTQSVMAQSPPHRQRLQMVRKPHRPEKGWLGHLTSYLFFFSWNI